MDKKTVVILVNTLVGFGLGALCYLNIKGLKQTKDITKKLNAAIDDLSESDAVDIQDEIIEASVDRAVQRKANIAISTAINRIVNEYEQDIRTEVRSAVQNEYDNLAESTKAEISKQIGRLNLDSIRREVVNEASEKAKRQFQSDLDKVVDKYNDQLDSIGDIYKTISEKITQ